VDDQLLVFSGRPLQAGTCGGVIFVTFSGFPDGQPSG
jgi:hypothetical protein